MARDVLDPVQLALIADFNKFEVRLTLVPSMWKAYPATKVYNWEAVPYDKARAKDVPDKEFGIYSFVLRPKIAGHAAAYILYIGKAERQSLRTRFKQYFREYRNPEGRPLIRYMLHRWGDDLEFCFTKLPAADVTLAEKELIMAFSPPYNDDVPAEIRPAVKAWRRG